MPNETEVTAVPTEADRKEAAIHIREAISYMVMMWDALREAETILGDDLEESQISGLASTCDSSCDAFNITDENIWEVLDAKD
jgi:hypothetical protein